MTQMNDHNKLLARVSVEDKIPTAHSRALRAVASAAIRHAYDVESARRMAKESIAHMETAYPTRIANLRAEADRLEAELLAVQENGGPKWVSIEEQKARSEASIKRMWETRMSPITKMIDKYRAAGGDPDKFELIDPFWDLDDIGILEEWRDNG